jgi:hypothetical protein
MIPVVGIAQDYFAIVRRGCAYSTFNSYCWHNKQLKCIFVVKTWTTGTNSPVFGDAIGGVGDQIMIGESSS